MWDWSWFKGGKKERQHQLYRCVIKENPAVLSEQPPLDFHFNLQMEMHKSSQSAGIELMNKTHARRREMLNKCRLPWCCIEFFPRHCNLFSWHPAVRLPKQETIDCMQLEKKKKMERVWILQQTIIRRNNVLNPFWLNRRKKIGCFLWWIEFEISKVFALISHAAEDRTTLNTNNAHALLNLDLHATYERTDRKDNSKYLPATPYIPLLDKTIPYRIRAPTHSSHETVNEF